MRLALVLALLAACSSKPSPPELSKEVARRLKTLASDCTEAPGNPGPPHGFHTVVTCYPPGDDRHDGSVTVDLLDKDTIGQILIHLTEPAETAIPKLSYALEGLVDADALKKITGELATAKVLAPSDFPRKLPIKSVDAMVSIEKFNHPTVVVSLSWTR